MVNWSRNLTRVILVPWEPGKPLDSHTSGELLLYVRTARLFAVGPPSGSFMVVVVVLKREETFGPRRGVAFQHGYRTP